MAETDRARISGLRKKFEKASTDTLKGHEKKVHALGWSCNGSTLASGSQDQTIRLWSTDRSRSQIAVLDEHKSSVEQVQWSPTQSNVLVSISDEANVFFWDSRAKKCTDRVETKGSNIHVAWSPDAAYVAVGNKSDVLTFIDVRKKTVACTQSFDHEVNEVQWDTTGKFFFMATQKSRGRGVLQGQGVLQAMRFNSTGAEGPKLTSHYQMLAHTSNCFALDVDPTGRYVASGAADALVCVWDLTDFSCRHSIGRLEWPVHNLRFSYDGTLLASGSEDHIIDIADTASGERVHAIETKSTSNSVAWHPKSMLLAYATDSGSGSGRGYDQGDIQLIGIK